MCRCLVGLVFIPGAVCGQSFVAKRAALCVVFVYDLYLLLTSFRCVLCICVHVFVSAVFPGAVCGQSFVAKRAALCVVFVPPALPVLFCVLFCVVFV